MIGDYSFQITQVDNGTIMTVHRVGPAGQREFVEKRVYTVPDALLTRLDELLNERKEVKS